MKKLTVAALVLSVLSLTFTVQERARAASCALPFTLTNGTTADATQVMGDFNALVSCIGSVVTGVSAGPSGNIVVTGTASVPIVDATAAPKFGGSIIAGGTAPSTFTQTSGDIDAARSAGVGCYWFGNGTVAQTQQICSNGSNTFGFFPQTNQGSAFNLSSGLAQFSGGVEPGTGNGALGSVELYSGAGAPGFNAPNGSLYLDFQGGAGSRLYLNTSGSSTVGNIWTAEL